MSYIFASFKSQNDAASAFGILRDAGIPARLISTPRATGLGCGLSVRFPDADKNSVKLISHIHSFSGLYLVTVTDKKPVITRLSL